MYNYALTPDEMRLSYLKGIMFQILHDLKFAFVLAWVI